MPVPTDIAIAYLIQGSFYGHSIYATIYMDAWRKDSAVMVVHHIITLALICFSYAFRYFTLSQCSRASVRTLHNAPIWKCFFKRWTAHCSFLFVKRMWQSRNLLLLCSRRLLLELLTVATFRRARMWIIGGVGGAKLRLPSASPDQNVPNYMLPHTTPNRDSRTASVLLFRASSLSCRLSCLQLFSCFCSFSTNW